MEMAPSGERGAHSNGMCSSNATNSIVVSSEDTAPLLSAMLTLFLDGEAKVEVVHAVKTRVRARANEKNSFFFIICHTPFKRLFTANTPRLRCHLRGYLLGYAIIIAP